MKSLFSALLVTTSVLVSVAYAAPAKTALPIAANDDFENERAQIAKLVRSSLQPIPYSRPENRPQFIERIQTWFARPDSVNAPEIFEQALPLLRSQARHVPRSGTYGGTHERIEILEILRQPYWRKTLAASGYRDELRYAFPNTYETLMPAASDIDVARWMFDEEDLSYSEEFAMMAERLSALEKAEASWRFYDQFRGEKSKVGKLSFAKMSPVYQEKLIAAMKSGVKTRDDRSLFEIGLKILPNDVLDDVIDSASSDLLSKAISWSFNSLSEANISRLMTLRNGKRLFASISGDRYYSSGMHLKLLGEVLKNSNDIDFIFQVLTPVNVRYAIGSDSSDIAEVDADHASYKAKFAAMLPEIYTKLKSLNASFSQLTRVVAYLPADTEVKLQHMNELLIQAKTGNDILSLLHIAESESEVTKMWTAAIPRLIKQMPSRNWATTPDDFYRLPPAIVDRLYSEGIRKVKTSEDFLHITRALTNFNGSAVVAKAMRLWSTEALRFYPSQVTKDELNKAIQVYANSNASPMRTLVDHLVKSQTVPMTCESLFSK